MNRTPPTRFEPSSRWLRAAFAVIALAMTLATAGLIDGLANGHGTTAPLVMHAVPAVVAQR